ncbi:flavin reductase family protein [Parvibaculaceae bacterium PLY_AMNH_Bact1]|nr:flavin reductase family protein [Parvibaculaceae bacterium PLY_AMNH_Bact1]
MNTLDSRSFRNALGEFATGVAIVTTQVGDDAPIGITVNSFSSVSLDPPLVLWCLDKGSDRLEAFEKCEGFTINILAAAQQELSNRLSRSGHPHLDGIPVDKGVNGCPYLSEALATFECDVHARHDAGDHIIMVGRVKAFQQPSAETPLIYHRGGYCALAI